MQNNRNDMQRFIVTSFIGLLLLSSATACSALLPSATPAGAFFVIEAAETPHEPIDNETLTHREKEALADVDLFIRETRANNFLNSSKIVFSSASNRRGYYQFASWVQPPAKRISTLLFESLNERDYFSSVSTLGSLASGHYQLNSELLSFHHDTQKKPGKAVVELWVEILDLRARQIIAQDKFQQEVLVESFSAEGAVMALTLATNQVLEDIVHWAVAELADASARDSSLTNQINMEKERDGKRR